MVAHERVGSTEETGEVVPLVRSSGFLFPAQPVLQGVLREACLAPPGCQLRHYAQHPPAAPLLLCTACTLQAGSALPSLAKQPLFQAIYAACACSMMPSAVQLIDVNWCS